MQVFLNDPSKKHSYFKTSYFLELIIVSIHPFPFLDDSIEIMHLTPDRDIYVRIKYYYSDFLLVLMFVRIHFLIKAVFNFTLYNDIVSKRIC